MALPYGAPQPCHITQLSQDKSKRVAALCGLTPLGESGKGIPNQNWMKGMLNASQQVLVSHVVAPPEHHTVLPLLTGLAPVWSQLKLSHVATALQHQPCTRK